MLLLRVVCMLEQIKTTAFLLLLKLVRNNSLKKIVSHDILLFKVKLAVNWCAVRHFFLLKIILD